MSSLNRRRGLDPRWPWHQRSVALGHMNATVEIFRRPGQGETYGYDPATGGLTVPDGEGGTKFPQPILLYRGDGRAANNKDWRSRVHTQRGDMGTVQAVRIQVPEHTCPPIHANDVIRVVGGLPDAEGNPTPLPEAELAQYIFHVRNPMSSSNAWLRNLLCDVDAAHPQSLPPPFTMQPVTMPHDAA